MSNDSTARGYLTPVGEGPKYDEELEREISRWIRGVSGLPAKAVFSRWTDPQPLIPKNGVTWCGFGITTVPQPLSQSDVQVSDEQSEQWTWEQVTVICCFYGPLGSRTASTFRSGIFVEQNNAELNLSGLSLVDAGTIYNLPELINNQWVRRYDLTITLSRKNTRTYNVRTLEDAPVSFFGD
ncbi:hypothetical protein LUS38_17575 [Escherichia coli]|uniref:phage neck terminator protein n=1 Tax=Escherichia coli TaxID=562 RepID=UPI001E45FFC9|nr:hypothetical protein [Escherichia coli]MCD9249018.1 hypothetical protein [Escherichia coli]